MSSKFRSRSRAFWTLLECGGLAERLGQPGSDHGRPANLGTGGDSYRHGTGA